MIKVQSLGQVPDLGLSFSEVSLSTVEFVHGLLLESCSFFIATLDHNVVLLRAIRIASLHTIVTLISAAKLWRKDSFLVCLVDHAQLAYDAAWGAHHGPFVLLHNKTISLATLFTLVIFDILLRLVERPILGISLTSSELLPFSFNLRTVLLQQEGIRLDLVRCERSLWVRILAIMHIKGQSLRVHHSLRLLLECSFQFDLGHLPMQRRQYKLIDMSSLCDHVANFKLRILIKQLSLTALHPVLSHSIRALSLNVLSGRDIFLNIIFLGFMTEKAS